MLPLLAGALAQDLALPRVPAAGIDVDGRADETAWAQALELPDAIVFQPAADVPPVGSMRTRVLATDEGLALHFSVTDPEPELVRAGLGRRDTRADDAVGIVIDPNGDGRVAYELVATALGVQSDRIDAPGEFDDDYSWDAVWHSAGEKTGTGYQVEMLVPWRALHLGGDVASLRLVVVRRVARKSQGYAWPLVDPGTDPILAAVTLRGPGPLPRRLGLELLPELTGAWSNPHVESGRFEIGGVGPGLTVRYAPGRRFSAVGTVNPDFSQLESDATQIDINQRYALFYEEKRPFFLEGQEWFDHPMDGIVYTRAMNAPLYGVRATGEAGPLGLAVLNVLDVAPAPSVNDEGGWTAGQLDGHDALATLARARVGLGGESYLGILGSDRTVLGTDLSNRVVGIDTALRLERRLLIRASALGSATTFVGQTVPRLAPAANFDLLWSGEALFLHAAADTVAPDFRQENGFVTQADFYGVFTEDHINFYPKLDWLPLVAIEPLDGWLYWRYGGARREQGYDPSIWARFGNGSFLKFDAHVAGEEFLGHWIPSQNGEVYWSLNLGEEVRLEVDGVVGTAAFYDPQDPRAGRFQSGFIGVAWQPVPSFTLSAEPELAQMQERDGTPLFVAWTARARAELFFNRAAWLRVVGELTDNSLDQQRWRVEPTLAWEWTPGRALYAGGAYGEDGERYWQVFAKVGWTFVL